MSEDFRLHSLAAAKAPRKGTSQRSGEVQVTRVANWEAVYAYALTLADGDPTRVTVTSEGEVIVKNRGRG